MKDNPCQTLQNLLVAQEDSTAPLPEELQGHLAQCRECQKTARLLKLLRHANEDGKTAPSPALDGRTLALCHKELRARRPRRMWLFRPRATLWAAAALLVAMAVLAVFTLDDSRPANPAAPHAETALADDAEWKDSLLDTGMDLVNDEISSMELNFNLLAADLYY